MRPRHSREYIVCLCVYNVCVLYIVYVLAYAAVDAISHFLSSRSGSRCGSCSRCVHPTASRKIIRCFRVRMGTQTLTTAQRRDGQRRDDTAQRTAASPAVCSVLVLAVMRVSQICVKTSGFHGLRLLPHFWSRTNDMCAYMCATSVCVSHSYSVPPPSGVYDLETGEVECSLVTSRMCDMFCTKVLPRRIVSYLFRRLI